jgi:hypothetical protein
MKGDGMKTVGRTAALLALLALGACHKRSEPPPAPTENVQPPAPPKPAPPPPPPEKPKPVKTVVVVPPDTDKPSDEDQMREDAEATGMTSRLTPTAAPSGDTGGGNSQ